MQLTYGQLESVLSLHLQIHPDKVPTFRSRLKQLQRLEFPPGVNVGRGSKMSYSAEHLFMLVIVFEILSFGLPAQTACKVVNQHWSMFAGGFALAALQERSWDNKNSEQVLAILRMHSLFEIQFDARGEVAFSSVKICDASVAKDEFVAHNYDREYSRFIVSVGRLLNRVIDIARDQAGVKRADEWDEEFNDWLPKGAEAQFLFRSHYPDRSNLEMRKRLHMLYNNDPLSLTPEGLEEANTFLVNGYMFEAPF